MWNLKFLVSDSKENVFLFMSCLFFYVYVSYYFVCASFPFLSLPAVHRIGGILWPSASGVSSPPGISVATRAANPVHAHCHSHTMPREASSKVFSCSLPWPTKLPTHIRPFSLNFNIKILTHYGIEFFSFNKRISPKHLTLEIFLLNI